MTDLDMDTFGGDLTELLSIEFMNRTGDVWSDVLINSSCETASLTGGTKFDYDEWNHVAMTYDGEYMTLYVNGEAGTPVAANKVCDDHSVAFNTLGQHLEGGMRDYTAYTSALSAESIRREATRGFRQLDLNFDEAPASQSFADSRNNGLSAT